MNNNWLIHTLLLLLPLNYSGQAKQITYTAPLDIPLLLSGNFGEFRTNHFHMGIDIKTQGVQGKNILAAADGFISRVNISPYGYGKALYIDHPNGQTTVYAHMKSFSDEVEAYILQKQYDIASFKISNYPDSNLFVIKQGDIIGLSGNTGHSGGPHLHFEIRDTDSEHPLNPLGYGFEIKDQTKPTLKGIRVYPINNGLINGSSEATSFTVKNMGKGIYKLDNDTIKINGTVGIGVHAIDKMINVSNTFSIYSLQVKSNGKLVYSHQINELDFETTRSVNCHMDYELYRKNRWKYHKCFPAKNNKLNIYSMPGTTFKLFKGDLNNISIEASDIEGNTVQVNFVLKGVDAKSNTEHTSSTNILLKAHQDNVFVDDDIEILFPDGVLYDDLELVYSKTAKTTKSKATYKIGTYLQPLQDKIYITIKLPEDDIRTNLSLYKVDSKGKYSICDSYVNDGYLHATTKDLGTFVLLSDTKSPVIQLKKFPKIVTAKSGHIAFALSDGTSGVNTIQASINGRWLMMGHNASRSYTYGDINDLDLEAGEHEFILKVTDASGNTKEFTKSFSVK